MKWFKNRCIFYLVVSKCVWVWCNRFSHFVTKSSLNVNTNAGCKQIIPRKNHINDFRLLALVEILLGSTQSTSKMCFWPDFVIKCNLHGNMGYGYTVHTFNVQNNFSTKLITRIPLNKKWKKKIISIKWPRIR